MRRSVHHGWNRRKWARSYLQLERMKLNSTQPGLCVETWELSQIGGRSLHLAMEAVGCLKMLAIDSSLGEKRTNTKREPRMLRDCLRGHAQLVSEGEGRELAVSP